MTSDCLPRRGERRTRRLIGAVVRNQCQSFHPQQCLEFSSAVGTCPPHQRWLLSPPTPRDPRDLSVRVRMVPTFDVSDASPSELAATHGSAVGIAPDHCRRRIELRSSLFRRCPQSRENPEGPRRSSKRIFLGSSHEVILDSASPSLRLRQTCAVTGFHATSFQFAAFTYYPVHHRTLRDTSGFDQNQPPKSRFRGPFGGLIRPITPRSITPIRGNRRPSVQSIPSGRCRWHNWFQPEQLPAPDSKHATRYFC